MYEERRKYPRLNINVNIQWRKAKAEEELGSVTNGVSRNISEGGICLMVYEKLNIGDILVLDIELPTGKVIHSRGKIVWTKQFEIIGHEKEKGYDVGVELVDIHEEDRVVLREFVFKFLKR